ncbi:hypothetical protein HNR32_002733 [Pectinatus brassicae]|uniref:Uncharacterized protein n=1 Tax=Pectinatus brassicae TaxID=862415 RepID=A0A840UIK3_9FIRM|nr:hypothetical protein [Pectinatus brassicae]
MNIKINPIRRIMFRMQQPKHICKRYRKKKKAIKMTFVNIIKNIK